MSRLTTFFDLDGTLLDHDGAALSATRDFYDAYTSDIAIPFASFLLKWRAAAAKYSSAHVGTPDHDRLQRRKRVQAVSAGNLTDVDADRRFQTYYDAYVSHWSLYPDSLACIRRRALLGPVGIVTNGTSATQRLKLSRTGLDELISFAVISEEVGFSKPDLRIFKQALVHHHGALDETCFVGDSLVNDVRGALAAGLPAVWLLRAPSPTGHVPAGVSVIPALDAL